MTTTQPIYNNYSIRQILDKLPTSLKSCKLHRNMYINNCIEVYNIKKSGINLTTANGIENSNFLLIQFYLKLDGIIN
jgi:hypothetical protein